MPVIHDLQKLNRLNTETRHGFEEQYLSEHLLESFASNFIFYFDDKRHKTNGNPKSEQEKLNDASGYYQPIQDWKIMKERQKTVSAALLLCLNLGVDPPDVVKTHPCARFEAWIDPLNFQDSKKAIEQIGKNLQSQYETLSLRTRYKQSLDPCVEDVKRFCNSLRRASKDERILFHYNGHGVPQPTPSGEIWVFNRGYTQYIPVSLYDLQTWLGAPCIYVWDCNSAGNIMINFQKFVQKRITDDQEGNHDLAAPSPTQAYTECVQLAACRSDELLPMNPELPADLFTCCLTCPIETSVKIFLMQSPLKYTKYAVFFQNDDLHRGSETNRVPNITIPGKLSERRTLLGELNWIFTAITDTIAWTSLPRPLFKKLFRHDLMVAALFRNFLLAKRIMPWYDCHPISDPSLPDSIVDHSMWKSWDLAIDEVLTKLISDMNIAPTVSGDIETQTILQKQKNLQEKHEENNLQSRNVAGNLSTMSLAAFGPLCNNIPSTASGLLTQPQQQFTKFFEQNLTAFELWLKYGTNTRNPPEQLPIVLQVLLSQVHRIRTLVLLSRFLDLGPWAVYLSLSIGIFPYVLKLLQSPAQELKPILVFIWARIMSIDYKNTQNELIKEKGYIYFLKMLIPEWGINLQKIPSSSTTGSPLTINSPTSAGTQRHQMYQQHSIPSTAITPSNNTTDEQKAMATFVLSSFVNDFSSGQTCCFSTELAQKLCYYIDNSEVPLLRQWCIILLGQLYYKNSYHKSICIQESYMCHIINSLKDPIPEVRCAALLALTYFCCGFDESEFILKLQQDFQQQIHQYQIQMNQLQSTQQQQQQMQQHQIPYQQLQHQHQQIQNKLLQLQNIDLNQMKREEIRMIVSALCLVNDGSAMVRKELVIFLSHIIEQNINFFIVIAFNELSDEVVFLDTRNTESIESKKKISIGYGSIFNTIWKALLILAEDPFLENSRLSGEVIDFILMKLSEHPELGDIVNEMEQYLVKRTTNSVFLKYQRTMNPTILPSSKITNNLRKSESKSQSNTPSADDTYWGFSLFSLLNGLGLNNGELNNGNNKNNNNNDSISHNLDQPPKKNVVSDSNSITTKSRALELNQRAGPIVLPLKSSFLDYSREYFQEPQMKKRESDEPGSLEYVARLWRRNRNETIIQETQGQKQLSLYGDWSHKVCTLDNITQPKLLTFTQFENFIVLADDKDNITVFDWEEKNMLMRFSNGNPFGTKITSIQLLNEDDVPLLLTGSSEGIVKIYKDFHCNKSHQVSSWRALSDLLLTPRSTGLLTEWQQSRGSLLVTGDVKIIRIWDALTETVEADIPAKSSSLITSLTSDQLSGNIFVAGFVDGSIRVYDRRVDSRYSMVNHWKSSGNKNCSITNIHLQRGGYRELISGKNNGVVELWDIRNDQPVFAFTDNEKISDKKIISTMTSMQVHEHAPIIATGTKQIKIWSTSGDIISSFKNNSFQHPGGMASTLATGISGRSSNSFLSTMAFHPHKMILAGVNSHDSSINIYQCRNTLSNYLYH